MYGPSDQYGDFAIEDLSNEEQEALAAQFDRDSDATGLALSFDDEDRLEIPEGFCESLERKVDDELDRQRLGELEEERLAEAESLEEFLDAEFGQIHAI